jgi:hypothetical protein
MADEDKGYGQQDPSDMAGAFNAHGFAIEQALARVSTAKIVLVKAVDTAAKTIDVQPMVSMTDGAGTVTAHGTIYGIPYATWQFGTAAVLADPKVNDIGVMLCADRDISSVKKTKKVAPPGSSRTHDVADGVYLGGILNPDPTQWVKFTDTGMELHDKNSNVLISSSSGWEFTGAVKFNQAVTMAGALQLGGAIVSVSGGRYSGNIDTSGTVKSGTTILGTHTHGGVSTGGGTSGPPT